ncbi:MAG: hypothetical protein IJM31_03010 [Campylobacter sp.]|nr:hypothetical protein [Campylobacter sp.]
MKLEDIAKTVIKDLEALEQEKKGLNKDLQVENLGENSADFSQNSANSNDKFLDDDLKIYSDIVLPNTKKSDLIAFNFHFESLNFGSSKDEEKKQNKNESSNLENSNLADEKYDFDDEKTDETLQNVTKISKDENLQNEFEIPKNESLKSEFENLENEDFSENLSDKITNDFIYEELEIIRDDSFVNSQNSNFENSNDTNFKNLQDEILQTNQLSNGENLQNFTQNSLHKEQNLENLQNLSAELSASISKINELLANLSEVKNDEVQFLSALKERILVLFEGLNAFEGDLEARVELSIKFMEFLLASIDNRVENLSK